MFSFFSNKSRLDRAVDVYIKDNASGWMDIYSFILPKIRQKENHRMEKDVSNCIRSIMKRVPEDNKEHSKRALELLTGLMSMNLHYEISRMIRIQIEQEEFQGEFRLAMSKANPETLQMMFTYLKKWIHKHSLPELRRFYEQLKSEGFNVNRSDPHNFKSWLNIKNDRSKQSSTVSTLKKELIVDCNICMEFKENAEIVATECGHLYHKNCIDQWLGRSSTCPDCRIRMTRSSLRKLFIAPVTHNIDNSYTSEYDNRVEASNLHKKTQIDFSFMKQNFNMVFFIILFDIFIYFFFFLL